MDDENKQKPTQGRTFFVAELYRAALSLNISDQAHRVLTAIIANTNMDPASEDYLKTHVGQEWIELHIGKKQKNVSKYVAELETAGFISVHRRRNTTNKTHLWAERILRTGKELSDIANTELERRRLDRKSNLDPGSQDW